MHWAWLIVDATLNELISHDVHLDGQVSHSCLLLFAIMLVPAHTPPLFVCTQFPPSEYVPDAQMVQSFDVGP